MLLSIGMAGLTGPPDAYDVTIGTDLTSGGAWAFDGNTATFTPVSTGATVSITEVESLLESGDTVIISTNSAGTNNGDIFVDVPISWTNDAVLVLQARRNIVFNASVTALGGSAGLTLTPNTGDVGGTHRFLNGAKITLSGLTPQLNINGLSYTLIHSLIQLQNIQSDLTGNYALVADLNASASAGWNSDDSGGFYGFSPLGDGESMFSGRFDGLGHVIANLYFNRPSQDFVGLFGQISSSASVRNIGLPREFVLGRYYVGGLVGLNNGEIFSSFNTGSIVGATNGNVNMGGGLVGYNSTSGNISESYTTASVVGGWGTGGFVGQTDGVIINCYSQGLVQAYNPGWSIGGFTGWYSAGSITYSYSSGYVKGGGSTVGGFSGGAAGGTATDDYYDISKSGVGGNCYNQCTGGTPLSTAQMYQQSSYEAWDFTNIWQIDNGVSYPTLLSVPVADSPLVSFTTTVGMQSIQPVTLTFTSAGSLSSIAALTDGSTEGDFQRVPGGSCSIETSYAVNDICTVNVVFSPSAVETVAGSVVLYDESAPANVLAVVGLSGTAASLLPIGTNAATVTLSATPNPSTYGQTITVTIGVTGAAGTPTGALNTYIDGDPYYANLDANGQVTIPISTLSVGTHIVIATYMGDSTYLPAASQLLTITVQSNGPTCDPPPSGLVSWWPADGNTSDINAGNNGTLTNGVTFGSGEIGQAFSFNGQNQYVLIGDPVPSSLQIQNQITLSAWIYATSYPTSATYDLAMGLIVGSQYDVNKAGATIFLDGRTNTDGMTNPAGHIHFQIGDGSWHECNTQTTVPLDQWVLITATRNANEDAIVYYNNLPQPITCLPWSGGISYNGAWFTIGQQKDLYRPFNGLIDDVRVFNRSLTPAEVDSIFTAGSAGVCTTPVPYLGVIYPDTATAGAASLTLSVTGSNFTSSSIVYWNGSARATTYISSNILQATITAADLAGTGTASVSVFNGPPGGGTSGTLVFTITPTAGGTSDLSLAAGAAILPSGSNPQYEAVVANDGPDPATNAVVTDLLTNFKYVAATYTTGAVTGPCSFVTSESKVVCYIGTMASGATGTIKIWVTPPSSGWASHEFFASADQSDPDPTNNAAHVAPTQSFNTFVGSNQLVIADDDVMVSFDTVIKPGNTTTISSALGVAPPTGYRAGTPATLHSLTSTAGFSGNMTIALALKSTTFHKPAKVRLFQFVSGTWIDCTTAVDPAGGRVLGRATSLSTFALFEPINHPPVAVVQHQVLSGTSPTGNSVPLYAGNSSDADDDALTYRWTGPFTEGNGTVSGQNPSVTLPIGVSTIALIANDGEADSAPSTATITITDFAVKIANPSATVGRGKSATIDLALSPIYGSYDNAVALSCPNMPAGMTCSFSSSSITPGANGATAQLTIATSSASASSHFREKFLLACGFFGLFGLVLVPRRRRSAQISVVVLVFALFVGLNACGGGGANQTSFVHQPSATTVTVTVNATSGALQHSAGVTVTLK